VTVLAPAGYGKTTLLGQVRAADVRPFAWVSLAEGDNDPVALMERVARELDRIAKVGPVVFEAPRFPAGAPWLSIVRRLGAAFSSIKRPLVLVLDDVHVLSDVDSLDAVAALSAGVPEGSQLMLVGRSEPRLGLARVRAEGRLAELGRNELALDVAEAGALLSGAGVNLPEPEVAELTRRTEGWAAGLYLAGRSLRERGSSGPGPVVAVSSPDGDVADYLRSEVLSRLKPEEVEFVTRTAVLERMCGPLSDAVVARPRAAAMLDSLRRSNRFVVPLDEGGEWYRYHHLFRDLLAHELERREPDVVLTLNRRAAQWYEDSGSPETAIEYAFAGGDLEHAARLVARCALRVNQSGRLETLCSWIDRLDQPGLLERHPAIAVWGAWAQGLSGHPAHADRLAQVAERGFIAERGCIEEPLADGSANIEPWLATLRASRCRHGVEQMGADAQRALELAPEWSFWRPRASVSLGIALAHSGDAGRADGLFADAVELAAEMGMNDDRSIALAERSLLAATRGDFRDAEHFAEEARRVVRDAGLDHHVTSAITYVALGKVALHRRDLALAEDQFAPANHLRPRLTWFMPGLAVQVRLELARARLANADQAGARVLLQEIDRLLRRVGSLGVLGEQAAQLRDEANELRTLSGDAQLLTSAELRVLSMLSTHLSIGDIAERHFVSRATVKTQAISIYRKLNVTSRSEAVQRAADIGLVDSAVVPPPRDFHPSG